MKNVILASASPRRSMLMKQMGIPCTVVPSTVEENITQTVPSLVVEELSAQKCRDVALQSDGTSLVIGADTIVAFGQKILGKPADAAQAEQMIRTLQGQTHQVYTGVTLMWMDGGTWQTKTFHEQTDVEVYPMTEAEIRSYIAPPKLREGEAPEWADKAGAYGIQTDFGARYIKGIHGDYYNVVGLPASRCYHELMKIC